MTANRPRRFNGIPNRLYIMHPKNFHPGGHPERNRRQCTRQPLFRAGMPQERPQKALAGDTQQKRSLQSPELPEMAKKFQIVLRFFCKAQRLIR